MEIGNIAEWVAALAALATAGIAGWALRSWQDQVRGTSRHTAAAEIAEAAQLTRYHFYDARNPMIFTPEFPASYHQSNQRSRKEEADGYAHVYDGRWKLLGPQILRLATLRAKAGALLSEDCAKALEELARKARELHNFFGHQIEQIRVGPDIVSQWPDQRWVQKVKGAIEVNPDDHSDPYSLEFETKFDTLRKSLEPYM